MIEWLGWAATAVFTLSYLCRTPAALTGVQMLGASMWVAYGVMTGARPVIAANLLVVAAGALGAWRRRSPAAKAETSAA